MVRQEPPEPDIKIPIPIKIINEEFHIKKLKKKMIQKNKKKIKENKKRINLFLKQKNNIPNFDNILGQILKHSSLKYWTKILCCIKSSYFSIFSVSTPKSVLEIVTTFEDVNNIKVPHKIGDRRAGDLDEFYADPTKAENELGWKAERDLDKMCSDAYNFLTKNK